MRRGVEPSRKSDGRNLLLDFLACALIILAHFINYVTYIRYYRLVPDILVVSAVLMVIAFAVALVLRVSPFFLRALILATLVSIVIGDTVLQVGISGGGVRLLSSLVVLLAAVGLVFFLREHTAKILIAVFAAILCSTVVVAYSQGREARHEGKAEKGSATLPVVLHIVLDEHMGLASMTDDLPGGAAVRHDVEAFYLHHGFRLFRRAYSEYFDTAPSLAATLNFDEDNKAFSYLVKGRDNWSLDTNAYFRMMAARGYRIRVYQSSYLDYCGAQGVTACITYRHDGFAPAAIASLGLAQRARLILDMYYSSIALVRLVHLAEEPVSRMLRRHGFGPVGFGLWHGRVGPLAIAPAVRALDRDLAAARHGTLFFVHLLTPHYPYVYGAGCHVVTPISRWLLRALPDGTNTPESRRRRYVQYLQQLRCTMQVVGGFMEALKRSGKLKDAVIIVHGDHGSRISRLRPILANAPALQKSDYLDGFSAFFAVRRPDLAAGMNDTMVPLAGLLAFAAGRDPLPASVARPRVFLEAGDRDYRPWPLPVFQGAGSGNAPR